MGDTYCLVDGALFGLFAEMLVEHGALMGAERRAAAELLGDVVVWAGLGGPFRIVSDAWEDEPPEWMDWPETV